MKVTCRFYHRPVLEVVQVASNFVLERLVLEVTIKRVEFFARLEVDSA